MWQVMLRSIEDTISFKTILVYPMGVRLGLMLHVTQTVRGVAALGSMVMVLLAMPVGASVTCFQVVGVWVFVLREMYLEPSKPKPRFQVYRDLGTRAKPWCRAARGDLTVMNSGGLSGTVV